MTFTIGHIDGGTHAGWKVQRPAVVGPWPCDCHEDSVDERAVRQSTERGLARLHVDGASTAQAPGMGARTPEPTPQVMRPAAWLNCPYCGTRRPSERGIA